MGSRCSTPQDLHSLCSWLYMQLVWRRSVDAGYWLPLITFFAKSFCCNTMRCATKFSLLFWLKYQFIVKMATIVSLKILPTTSDNAFQFFGQSSNTITVEVLIFWDYPRIKQIWNVFIWVDLLISETICRRVGQVIVGRRNISGTWCVG